GFFTQLAQRGRPRVLPDIDAALRHLPGMLEINVLRSVDAPANKRASVAIEEHNADAGTVRQIFNAHCENDGLRATSSRMPDDPQFARVCHHDALLRSEQAGHPCTLAINASLEADRSCRRWSAGAAALPRPLAWPRFLPSMIVTVMPLGGFAGADGCSVAVAAASAASFGAGACG